MTLYETLGVDPAATRDEIQAAYRAKAREHHPDRGGDTETMQRVNRAYGVLADPDRRRRYDETGEGDDIDPFENILMERIARAIASAQPGQNVVKVVRAQIQRETNEFGTTLVVLRQGLKRWEGRAEEFVSTGPRNLFAMAIRRKLEQERTQIAHLEEAIRQGERMMAIIDQHEHRVREEMPTKRPTVWADDPELQRMQSLFT